MVMIERNLKPLAGRLLISEPSMRDYYFRKAVVLLADHNDQGSFGLIINKPINLHLNEVIKDIPDFPARVYMGGPVKTDNLFFLHTLGNKIDGSIEIVKGLFWGGNVEQITAMIRENTITTEQVRFFVGYAGWMSNQLDREMKQNSWVVSFTNKEQVLCSNPDALWNRLIRRQGKEYAIWANYPPDPMMN